MGLAKQGMRMWRQHPTHSDLHNGEGVENSAVEPTIEHPHSEHAFLRKSRTKGTHATRPILRRAKRNS